MKINDLLYYHSEDLRDELARRETANRNGKCDACGDWHDAPSCNSLRHSDAGKLDIWCGRWLIRSGREELEANRADGARIFIDPRRQGVVQVGRGEELYSTQLPDHSVTEVGMTDRERVEWAIAWAESELAETGEASS